MEELNPEYIQREFLSLLNNEEPNIHTSNNSFNSSNSSNNNSLNNSWSITFSPDNIINDQLNNDSSNSPNNSPNILTNDSHDMFNFSFYDGNNNTQNVPNFSLYMSNDDGLNKTNQINNSSNEFPINHSNIPNTNIRPNIASNNSPNNSLNNGLLNTTYGYNLNNPLSQNLPNSPRNDYFPVSPTPSNESSNYESDATGVIQTQPLQQRPARTRQNKTTAENIIHFLARQVNPLLNTIHQNFENPQTNYIQLKS